MQVLCECGCGESAPIARQNDPKRGYTKGQPVRFVKGHSIKNGLAPWFKGDQAGYRAIHTYLRKHFPKAGACEECGKEGRTDYALIRGREYSRKREDYRELCRRCHVLYDELGYCSYWKKQGRESVPSGEPPACKCGCGAPVSWSRSKKDWHRYITGHNRRQAERAPSPVRLVRTIACGHCGRDFTAKRSDAQFCSKACKAAQRRADRKDDVERPCHQCGGTFIVNRYDKSRHCSKSCAATCQHAGGCPSREERVAA